MQKFVAILVCFILAGCSLPGTQSESASTDSTFSYVGSGFSMSLPKTWVEAKANEIPSPRHGAVMAAYISPDVKYGFANNVLIMRDALASPVTSKKYSELNNLQTTKNYLEYTKLQSNDITFTDSDTSLVYVFEARYNANTPLMKFIQTAKVCGTEVYLLHFTLSLDKDAAKYIDLMKTFECK